MSDALLSPSDTARSPVSPKASLKVRLGALETMTSNESSEGVGVIFFLCFVFHTSDELHAEVCYAECLLQRAALTFLQVRRHFRTLSSPCNPFSRLLDVNLPPLCSSHRLG